MKKHFLFLGVASAIGVLAITASAPADPAPPTVSADEGKRGFLDVARVLQSPRCLNCHPSGAAPLQGDQAKPHAMNITRTTVDAGMSCATCHQERNSEAIGVVGGPPGAPRWGLPADDMPLVFQGLTPTQLCEQMKDPARNGHKDFAQLFEHVDHDPLVLWGWAPGGTRTLPPLSHAAFVEAFKKWMGSGGACP